MILTLLAATVALATSPPIRPGIPGYPRIARPTTDAHRRINAALARLDRTVARSARDCLDGDAPNRTEWQRTVHVTMRGPEFLSYMIEDYADCGGAHPDDSHSAIVYDLATGAPVDWATLLPARLRGELALTTGGDSVRVVTLASPRLSALYAAGYDAAVTAMGNPDCRGLPEPEPGAPPTQRPMLAWLDARAGGLVLQFDWNHAMQACSAPVVLPIATLRREGVSPRLLRALAEAQAHVVRPPQQSPTH